MVNHYLSIAIRRLLRQKVYSLINLTGLAIGMACCMLILLYVRDELSYDRFHTNADRIYRVVEGQNAKTAPALATTLYDEFPEVKGYVRIVGTAGVWMMKYQDKVFYENSICSTAIRPCFCSSVTTVCGWRLPRSKTLCRVSSAINCLMGWCSPAPWRWSPEGVCPSATTRHSWARRNDSAMRRSCCLSASGGSTAIYAI